MEELKERIADLAIITIAEHTYLSYQAVTDAVAASLFPGMHTVKIDETQYRRILEKRMSLVTSLDIQASPN